jgi:hypothetical protein
MGNDAFAEDPCAELKRILNVVNGKVAKVDGRGKINDNLVDINGNSVGRVRLNR